MYASDSPPVLQTGHASHSHPLHRSGCPQTMCCRVGCHPCLMLARKARAAACMERHLHIRPLLCLSIKAILALLYLPLQAGKQRRRMAGKLCEGACLGPAKSKCTIQLTFGPNILLPACQPQRSQKAHLNVHVFPCYLAAQH
jgi:hypothetical protein